MRQRILVVSSVNMDLAAQVESVPAAGETVMGSQYDFIPGGKGGNAAIALARLGADSVLCSKLGNDSNGNRLTQFYKECGIDTRFIYADKKEKTGLAVVLVEGTGNNRIIVYAGANMRLNTADVEEAFTCLPDAAFVQFEIPTASVIAATQFAAKQQIPVFIDAGPASPDFPLEELQNVEIFSPNESETFAYTGIMPNSAESCLKACLALADRVKAKYYVLKLGSRGAFLYDGKYYKIMPPHDVDVVDTTAAGDAFTAALTLEYLQSHDIKRAVDYANIVGSLTVSKAGASPSLPTYDEVKDFIYDKNINYKL